MTRLLVAGLLLTLSGVASADTGEERANEALIQTFDPESAVAPISVVEGPGIKVGESTTLHPVFGVETGVVSNVFYEETAGTAAGILRIIAQIGTGSLNKARMTPNAETDETMTETRGGGLAYRADLRASYDAVLSGNDAASSTGGLGLGASLHGIVNPKGKVQFSFDDDFVRLIRAANFETDANTNRDINKLQLGLNVRPGGGTIVGSLYYSNLIDIFEKDEQKFANRIDHRVGLRVGWQFFPRSQLYLDVSQGYITGLGSAAAMKTSSFPLVAKVGFASLLSLKTTINLEAGYTNGFYDGPSYSAPVINAQVAYRYSPLGRVGLLYSLAYQDSINANYYRDHIIRLWARQIFMPIVVMVQPEVHFRKYDGIDLVMGAPTRDDVIVSVIAGASYNFRNWIAATLNYRLTLVETDYRYTGSGNVMVDDPSFVRHEVLAGMRVAL
ncbi:MAG: hypothetical protein ACKV2T_09575 [Kofleriaceae bacterium]